MPRSDMVEHGGLTVSAIMGVWVWRSGILGSGDERMVWHVGGRSWLLKAAGLGDAEARGHDNVGFQSQKGFSRVIDIMGYRCSRELVGGIIGGIAGRTTMTMTPYHGVSAAPSPIILPASEWRGIQVMSFFLSPNQRGNTMTEPNPKLINRSATFLLAVAGILMAGLSSPVLAEDPVHLKGTWSGEIRGISLGDALNGVTVDADTKAKIETFPIEMVIDFQDGSAIAGVKKHKYGNDRFVSVFRHGNTSLHGADAEGDMEISILSKETIESCYTEHEKHRVYASCTILQRKAQ